QLAGQLGEAEACYRRAEQLLDELVNEFPAVPEYQQKLAVTRSDLKLLQAQAKPSGAAAALREATKIQEGLVRDYPEVPDYAAARAARLAEPLRRELEDANGERAVRVLRQAVKRGWLQRPEQIDRQEFEPLRKRRDFDRLRDNLERGTREGFGRAG